MANEGEAMNNRRRLLVAPAAGALAFAAPPGSFGQHQGKVCLLAQADGAIQ